MTQNFLKWNVEDVILDLYKVTDVLGEGGFGKVYKVRHQGWNIDLAVKIPKPVIVETAGGIKNFEREAETWVNLGLHPHIVSCYYVRRIENSPVVFAEYVAGGSLHDWIYSRRLYEGGREDSLRRILDIAIQFAWGLHYAHERGLIHQDVKPANVMMTAEGVVKVTDFGLANSQKVLGLLNLPIGKNMVPVRIISSSSMTPGYCSPEQAKGNNLTRRTDLWSWALSVLEMFQGERTWGHGTVAIGALEFYLEESSENFQLPQMPMSLAQLLRHCFRENPNERPQDMLQVADELQGIYHQVTGKIYPQQPPQTAKDIADSINNRAVSLFDLGNQYKALQLWEQALQVQPQHLESTYNQGLILWREAKTNDEVVVRDMEQVRQSYPENWEADYLLSLIHLERDDCPMAINTLEDIRGEEAQNSKVKEALEFARERLPSSWGLHTVNQLKLLHPHLWEDYQPEEMALSCEDNILKVSSATTGKCLCILKGHTGKVNTAYITTDGKFVVSRGHDLNIKLWEISTGRCLHTLKDKEAVSGSMQGQGLLKISISLTGERRDPMDYYDKSKYVATLMLSQILTTEMALSINLMYEQEIKQAQTAFNQGDYIAAAQHIRSARSHPGCDRAYEAVNLWASLYVHLPCKSFLCAWESNTFAEYSKKADRLCLSADTRFVFSGTNLGNLDLWEIITGRIVSTFAENINYLGGVCLSGDHQLALSSEGKTLKLWSIQTGDCLRTFEGHTELVETLCFSPDNKFILSGSNDNTLKLWEVVTGRCLYTFEGHTKSVTSVCLSADGRFAVSGSRDDTLKLWEITTGRCLRSFEHPDDKRTEIEERNTHLSKLEFGNYIVWESGLRGVNSVNLSPNGKFALSGSGNTLKLWDVQTGLCLRTFTGHKDSVVSVCLSADCKFALSGSSDHTLKLWEVATGICLHTFEGHTDWVSEVFLSADSRFVLSASRDKALKLWVLDWELEEKLANDSDEGIAN